MSRLRCLCGNGMSNSTVPSDSIVEIYRKEDLNKAIEKRMELVDLWDEFREFWYCQVCKRITVINRRTGEYIHSYSRQTLDNSVEYDNILDWQELFFWRDHEFYDAIEEIEHRSVEDFVRRHPSRYLVRISHDLALVHVFSPHTMAYLFSYILDPSPDFAKKESQR